jgi:hypothetical protein
MSGQERGGPVTEAERVSLAYGEAYEKAFLADEACRKASGERLEAMAALDKATRDLEQWFDSLTATVRLAVKDRHPEIDPTRTLGS